MIQRQCTAARNGASANIDDNYHVWRQPPTSSTKFSTDNHETTAERRTAIVLRTWDAYNYSGDRRSWLRTLISETSLHTGGEYEVFLLVNVKDDSISLLEDAATYEQSLRRCVPEEFCDMALLYNKRMLEAWYPDVPEHGAQDQMYQALQVFSHQFPRFTHVWQLEMDLRLTGHVHSTLETATKFASAQPRRNLWERNGRFFISELYEGSYKAFADDVDAEFRDSGYWGPVEGVPDLDPKGPKPPPRTKRSWGFGEDAELISFMPMIDPIGTDWIYEKGIHGFATGPKTPRRVAIVSMTRASRRLLQIVSEAQRLRGQWLVSESTLETFALLHGLKAVTVPHPIAFANGLTPKKAELEFHKGPRHSKAGGHAPTSFYTSQGWVPGSWTQSSY